MQRPLVIIRNPNNKLFVIFFLHIYHMLPDFFILTENFVFAKHRFLFPFVFVWGKMQPFLAEVKLSLC